MEEEYNEDECEEDEESGGFILSFDGGEKGAKLTSKKDYEESIENQQKIIMEFLEENVELFNKFLKKEGISEEEFNGGKARHSSQS
jgi:hypothetical protein